MPFPYLPHLEVITVHIFLGAMNYDQQSKILVQILDRYGAGWRVGGLQSCCATIIGGFRYSWRL